MFRLLCFDGGGIRGLITALLVQDLETGYGIVSSANGFAGTSTGGLIALALAKGVKVDAVINIYQTQGKKIFDPNGWLLENAAKLAEDMDPDAADVLFSGPGVFECQYTNKGLIEIATKLLGSTLLRDCTKYVAVNSARLWDGHSWMATTLSNATGNAWSAVSMADAALATSAAPTYFPPHAIGNDGYFADGGTFANNPCMTALADARSGGHFDSLDDVRVLSLGTGNVNQGIPPGAMHDPLDWGVTHWMWPFASGKVPAMPLLDLMMTCTSQVATQEARHLLADRFCRGNVLLPQPYALDDWEHVAELEKLTRAYMQTAEWAAVRAWVKRNWSGA